MINNSKILTVSYGTFSCTLEGFDDSFGTMKAIAEYFRDLAADDRYFGAEPPTPDAEMLARIAEREIARRVNAHEDGGKIVLRAEQPSPAALTEQTTAEAAPRMEAPAPSTPAQAPRFTAPMPMPTAPAAQEDAQPEAEAPAEVAEAPAEDTLSDEDFAANIAALTAEEESDAAEAEESAPEISEDEESTSEPEEDSEVEEVAAEEIEAEDAVEEIESEAPEDTEAELADADETAIDDEEAEAPADMAAEFAEDMADEMPSYEAADMTQAPAIEPVEAVEEAEEVVHPDPDSVAAKLRRIRSVVAQSDQGYGDTDYSEDEHAQSFLDEAAADLDAALAADDAAELNAAEAEDEVADETDALLANIAAHTDEYEDEAEAESSETATQEAEEEAQAEVAEEEPQVETAEEEPQVEDTLAQLLADAMPDTSEADMDDDEADEEIETEAERPLDARVVKMKRSVLEEAMASGELVEEGTDEDTVNLFSDEAEDDFDNALSPEEEAELQRELAEVEADFAPEMDADEEEDFADAEDLIEAEIVTEVEAEAEDESTFDMAEDELQEAIDDASTTAARGVDRLQAVEKTSDVSRIFDEADSQSHDADSSARRNAIQHLRAAVAATRADKKAGVDISKDKDDSVYRSDLADMVRPRRPQAGGAARSERPGTERPAPLKLVAEQRIDTPRDPVQPRRIRTSDITDEAMQPTGDTSGNFADFAEEMGAGSLPELLEAAAAYMADVEGRPQFSRPMLMGKLKEVEGDSFSREDGLRSFGQLLRQGKLQKLKGGRFAVTDETEYRAEARNVG